MVAVQSLILLAALSTATQPASKVAVHTIDSEFQKGPSEVHVLLPDRIEPGRGYPVLYVLPVYPTPKAAATAIEQARADDLANRFNLICVTPAFDAMPWYADEQESHLLKAVIPFVEKTYPALAEARGRLLVGYSKSGWGALTLLLRNPDVFGRAASFDAPFMMGRGGTFGVPEQMQPMDHFARFCVPDLLESRAELFRAQPARIAIFGHKLFGDDDVKIHERMESLKIPHLYDHGPERKHAWNSGWLTPAVEALVREKMVTP